jgi:hypothetical protein
VLVEPGGLEMRSPTAIQADSALVRDLTAADLEMLLS